MLDDRAPRAIRWLMRRIGAAAKAVGDWATAWTALGVSYLEPQGAVLLSERPSAAPAALGARVVVFTHFDGQGCIRDHTRAYIDALIAEGLDLVFVTNSERLAPADLDWIRARAAFVMIRRNHGYDFAAWRDAIAACGLPDAGTQMLILANDSVYGPLRPLHCILDRLDFHAADVWSATDSWQHRFHLQSYFVAFGPAALRSPAFPRFWASVRSVRSKWWVVRRYEIGLTRACLAAGLRCRAMWRYTALIDVLRDAASRVGPAHRAKRRRSLQVEGGRGSLPGQGDLPEGGAPASLPIDRRNLERIVSAAHRQVPLNPTADLWQILIQQGCPFIKRELLRNNPSKVPDVVTWRSVIGSAEGFDTALIMRDLERVLRNRTP